MNILEVNKFYYSRRGAERHMLDVIDLFESNGDSVAVFAMKHPKNIPSKWERFFVSYVGYNAEDSNAWQKLIGIGRLFWSFEARRNMKNLLKEFRPDVAHLHNIYHQISSSVLTPLKRSGAKVIMTVHDYNLVSPDKDAYYECVGRSYWKFLFVKKYGLAKRLLLVSKMYVEKYFDLYGKTVDIFIAPSAFVKNVLIRGGMNEKKIVVIPHFTSRDRSESEFEVTEDAAEEKYALYFGSMSREKGIVELAALFDALRIPLVLAGGCEQDFVMPKGEQIRYVGYQDAKQLERLIRNASCVVSGSRLPETFGLIALEALSFGKPFFGLKSGAYTEIIKNRKNGFLANDFEGLKNIVERFFSGEISFDIAEIQQNAYDMYGKNLYLRAFEKLVDFDGKKT